MTGKANLHHRQFNADLGAIRRQNLRTGIYDIHTNMMQVPASMQPTHARIEQVADSTVGVPGSKIFTPLDPSVPRNFKILDVTMETPPCGIAPGSFPGKDVPDFLKDFQGLGAMSDEIKDLLPPECRVAFDAALAKENAWKAKWGTEQHSTHRRDPVIDTNIVPYPKHQPHHPQHGGQ
jgi:chromatin structure-remodeling complex protein RSC7